MALATLAPPCASHKRQEVPLWAVLVLALYPGDPVFKNTAFQELFDLEKNGIDAVLKDEIIGTLAPHLANYGASKAVRVKVKAEDVRQAEELLQGA